MGHKEVVVARTVVASSLSNTTRDAKAVPANVEDTPRTIIGINKDGTQFSRQFPNDALMKQFLGSLAGDGIEILRAS